MFGYVFCVWVVFRSGALGVFFKFCNHLAEEEKVDYFTSLWTCCCVPVSDRAAVVWSVFCACGIS